MLLLDSFRQTVLVPLTLFSINILIGRCSVYQFTTKNITVDADLCSRGLELDATVTKGSIGWLCVLSDIGPQETDCTVPPSLCIQILLSSHVWLNSALLYFWLTGLITKLYVILPVQAGPRVSFTPKPGISQSPLSLSDLMHFFSHIQ